MQLLLQGQAAQREQLLSCMNRNYTNIYNTMENTANQNAGNQLYVCHYYTHSSHHALQPYNLLYIFYGMR